MEDYLEHAPKELYEPQKDAESTGQNISEDDKIETKAEEKKIGEGVGFERIRRITGYLVGTVERFNNGKKAEEHDRVKHTFKTCSCGK